MILKNLALTNAYQAVPLELSALDQIYSWSSNVWSVSIALTASPSSTDEIVLWPSQWITFDWLRSPNVQLYAKSSQATWDVLYMIQN